MWHEIGQVGEPTLPELIKVVVLSRIAARRGKKSKFRRLLALNMAEVCAFTFQDQNSTTAGLIEVPSYRYPTK